GRAGGRCLLARRGARTVAGARANGDRARLLQRPDRRGDRAAAAGAARVGEELEAARPEPARGPAGGGVDVTHEQASTRLPDLLADGGDGALLAHVRECPACQRELFLLGRVDRLLRERAAVRGPTRARRPAARRVLAAAAVVLVAAATYLVLLVVQHGPGHEMMFRTASGRPVGHA